jgi:hypothetical protein
MPHFAATLLLELVAGVLLILFAAYTYDMAAPWLGWSPTAFCTIVSPMGTFAGSLGVLFTALGVVVWAISRLRGDAGPTLIIGGVLLLVAPMVFGHYLGIACIQ